MHELDVFESVSILSRMRECDELVTTFVSEIRTNEMSIVF
jgi:hypothetical protein